MTKVTQAHVDARVQAIGAAARDVFARRGVAAATMQEIAAKAGISTGAIYRYFPGKDDLIAAAFAEGRERTQRTFEEAAGVSGSPLEVLIETGRRSMHQLRDPKTTCLDMEMTLAGARKVESAATLIREFHLAIIAHIQELVVAAQAAGEVDSALDARSIAVLLLAYVQGMGALQLQMGAEADADATLDLVAELLKRTAPTRP